jgi:tetratricopeptide (TPR) repeat protein
VPYCNYGYYYPANYSTTYVVAAADETVAAAPDANAVAALEPDADSAAQFAEQGEANFRAGKYREALRDWKHALVDDPRNGGVMLLLAQTLFALGQYDEAAGATQAAMQMLPEDKWGVVATNYSQLYGNTADYTTQLRALEKARTDEPDNPALRFLLGFHYGFLNYPKNAVKELDKALTLVPKDLGSFKLRQMFAAKWPEAPPPPAAAVEAAKEAEQQGPAGEGAPPAPAPAPAPTPA